MSYIIADKSQEKMIKSFRSVVPENKLKDARFSCVKNKDKNYIGSCKTLCLNPSDEDVIISWYHLGHRFLRGLI